MQEVGERSGWRRTAPIAVLAASMAVLVAAAYIGAGFIKRGGPTAAPYHVWGKCLDWTICREVEIGNYRVVECDAPVYWWLTSGARPPKVGDMITLRRTRRGDPIGYPRTDGQSLVLKDGRMVFGIDY